MSLDRMIYTCERNAQEWRDGGENSSEGEADQWDEIAAYLRSLKQSSALAAAPAAPQQEPVAWTPTREDALAAQVLVYEAALKRIIRDDDCDPAQVAHTAITPYTPWKAVDDEFELAADSATSAHRPEATRIQYIADLEELSRLTQPFCARFATSQARITELRKRIERSTDMNRREESPK